MAKARKTTGKLAEPDGNGALEIGYCGLYCAECPSHTGKIADLARDLRKELREMRYEKAAEQLSKIPFFKALEHYPECYDVLGQMVKMRCNKVCRTGGGNPSCAVRACARKNGYEGCWECVEYETCEKMDFLKHIHGRANATNLKAIKKGGVAKFLKGKKYWYCE